MSYQLLIIEILAAPLLGAALLFVSTTIKIVAARRYLEKRGGGLKILDKFSIWAGHVNSYMFARGQMYLIALAFQRFNAKTLGWLYGPKKSVISVDLELIKQMVLDQQEIRRPSLEMPVKEVEVDSIFSSNGDQWRRIRRAIAPAFRSNKFKTANVEREIDNSIVKLIGAIEAKFERTTKRNEIELNIQDYAHRYSLDLVFSCFFKQTDLIDFDAKVDKMTRVVNLGLNEMMWNPLVRLTVVFPILKSTIDWLITHFHPQGVWREQLMDFIKQQTKLNLEARKHLQQLKAAGERVDDEDNFTLADGTTRFRRNMIDHVIDQFYEGKLTKTEYFHTIWFLLGAADRTASDSIAHTFYQLATHLDVQEKLRESILAKGAHSEYLAWVINESLRMLPPAPSGSSRVASRDYKCEDGIVPANTLVINAAYSIHRLKDYWGPDVEEFKPDRFANAKHFHPVQFIPFGVGSRACPGKEFALHEMKKLFCSLLTRYKFQCEPMDVEYSTPFFMVQIPDKHVILRVSRV